ncbi:hypothetical protein [Jeotgalibacillus terrae]|uniref:Uncharacterized protein n=1 Tax=Jeotgalibacillus terrae TaxID=587735 RepID=A0ABW5ZCI0_9BACL|nr:hypothetical protein [Jeotgalibacillus terrae]MBM7577891.1 hypothetical protein [Jeotgalibacillus terrae]
MVKLKKLITAGALGVTVLAGGFMAGSALHTATDSNQTIHQVASDDTYGTQTVKDRTVLPPAR